MKIKGKSKDPKRAEADQKRIQSMVQMKKDYKYQKDLIKEALSTVDAVHKNKIIFNDDDDIDIQAAEVSNGHHIENATDKKRRLFDDDDNEEDVDNESINFEVKEQFQGKKGQKLLELQARFKKDERFKMDERFLDDEDESKKSNDVVDNEDDEHRKQLEILQQVLGKSAAAPTPTTKESQKAKMMLRFDPTQPEHSKFEIKEEATVRKKKEKQTKSDEANETLPNVSKDTFYEVNEGLKDIFQEKQEFSLLSMFNQHVNIAVPENTNDVTETEVKSAKKSYKSDSNPFKYDSSSDEEDDEEGMIEDDNEEKGEAKKPVVNTSTLWTESLFFKVDDYRLQEGLDFIKKMEIEELSEFSKLRRDLKHIVKTKVKQNQRKNKPFKKKLGGRKKMIRIKKAMKR